MATTKVRKATPMRNKTKLWRRMAVKGYGRRLKAATAGYNHPAYPHEQIIGLMKRAGIETPIFDSLVYSANLNAGDAEVTDGDVIVDVETQSVEAAATA